MAPNVPSTARSSFKLRLALPLKIRDIVNSSFTIVHGTNTVILNPECVLQDGASGLTVGVGSGLTQILGVLSVNGSLL